MNSRSDLNLPNIKPPMGTRRMERTADGGFTLVEGVVTAVIFSILAGIMLTLLSVNNSCVKDGAVKAKVRSQYEISVAEIGTYTRRACAVLDNEGSGETYLLGATYTAVATSKIMMYSKDANGNGIPIRGFWVDGGQLREWKPGWDDFRPFTVGAWPTVSIVGATPFHLSADRKTVTLSMGVSATFAGVTAVAPARAEVYICRN